MSGHDVIVVGLGGNGSAAAYHLARRGVRVLGLERFGPAHDRGSSHGGSRIIRQSYFEGAEYVPLVQRAYELIAEAEAATGRTLMTVCGGVYLGRPDSELVAGSRHAAETWNLPHHLLDADEVRREYPTITPFAGHVALVDEVAGVVRPEALVQAHLDLAAIAGADLRFGEEVAAWTGDGDGVSVTLADGSTHHADRLVLTPGAWAPGLLADLGVPMRVERLVQHWFEPAGGTGPFEQHPIWISDLPEPEGHPLHGQQVYGFPAIDGPGGGVKVAFFRLASDADPDRLRREVDAGEVGLAAEQVARVLPAVGAGRHLRSAPCMYTTTPDEHFVIARHPGHERVSVACGMSGHGFKFTPVVGEILADLTVDGATRHPIDGFSPTRFG